MKRPSRIPTLSLGCFVICVTLANGLQAQAKPGDFPQIPGAELLTGYASYALAVTSPREVRIIQNSGVMLPIAPSMSRDGTIVASAYQRPGTITLDKHGRHGPVVFATYSVVSKMWREYGEHVYVGTLAVSPDGTQLAYCDYKGEAAPAGLPDTGQADTRFEGPVRLHILDLRTGVEQLGPALGNENVGELSWFPDGRRIAYSIGWLGGRASSSVWVADLESGKTSRIVSDGAGPAWSPSGEWLAYVAPSDRHRSVWVVHPNGTGARRTLTLRGNDEFSGPLVWSPDSKQLLLNTLIDIDSLACSIKLMDVSTLEIRRLFRHKAPILAWAEWK